MSDLAAAWFNLKRFDELGQKGSVIHRVHPVAKLLTTVVYIVLIVSFDKTEIIPLLPLVLYPLVLIILGELPVKLLFQRIVIATPLVLGIGLFNPWFDQSPAWTVGRWVITNGWISLAALMFRFGLTAMAALVLMATSGIEGVT